MLTLYPEIKPYTTQRLKVDSLHELYIEESGNPDGMPALVIHGGPGGGCDPQMRRFFDPDNYRIIIYDQRGAGRSTPHASLEGNNTAELISDIEQIRKALNIDSWLVFGGSWGATLGLLYAQSFPEHVQAMILRGIFLCRQKDLDWLYLEGGASRFFPDKWQTFIDPVKASQRDDLLNAYYHLLTSDNELKRMGAAKAWSGWEAQCSTLTPSKKLIDNFCDPHKALALARIECHYFRNKGFITENQILSNIDRVAHIPATIIHGRYDMVCPVDNAAALHKDWLSAKLQVIREAGHASSEPSIIDALVHATQDMAYRFGPHAS